jgi:hypothetical protein
MNNINIEQEKEYYRCATWQMYYRIMHHRKRKAESAAALAKYGICSSGSVSNSGGGRKLRFKRKNVHPVSYQPTGMENNSSSSSSSSSVYFRISSSSTSSSNNSSSSSSSSRDFVVVHHQQYHQQQREEQESSSTMNNNNNQSSQAETPVFHFEL